MFSWRNFRGMQPNTGTNLYHVPIVVGCKVNELEQHVADLIFLNWAIG